MATKPAVAAREIIVCYENDESFGMRPQSLEEENGTPKENTRLSVVALSAEDDPVSVIEQLEEDPAVKYAEPNYILQAQVAPNDQSYVDQWALSEINAISAWDTAVEAEGALAPVTVAVIDSGVDGNHEDLAGKILPGYNTVGGVNSADSSDDSGNGHGTHIAGVIAAQTNNVTGVAGASGN
jgi:subtilisin family serine protease